MITFNLNHFGMLLPITIQNETIVFLSSPGNKLKLIKMLADSLLENEDELVKVELLAYFRKLRKGFYE